MVKLSAAERSLVDTFTYHAEHPLTASDMGRQYLPNWPTKPPGYSGMPSGYEPSWAQDINQQPDDGMGSAVYTYDLRRGATAYGYTYGHRDGSRLNSSMPPDFWLRSNIRRQPLSFEVTAFAALVGVRYGERMVPNPNYVPPQARPRTMWAKMMGRPPQTDPAIGQETITEHIQEKYPVMLPMGGRATRWTYAIPRPDYFAGGNETTVGVGNLSWNSLTQNGGMRRPRTIEAATVVLPEQVATQLWGLSLEKPAVNRKLAHRVMSICVPPSERGSVTWFTQDFPNQFKGNPDGLEMRLLWGDYLQEPVLVENECVPVGSSVIEED